LWDRLPLNDVKESVLRFDEMQRIGRDPAGFICTDHCLTDQALCILDEWLDWYLISGEPPAGNLKEARDLLREAS